MGTFSVPVEESVADRGTPGGTRRWLIVLRSWCVDAALALTPLVVASLLVWVYFDRSLFDFRPVWSDELDYWLETRTARSVGFGGGYYTVNEMPAGWGPFGAHGPAFPILFAILSFVLPWSLSAGPMINVLVLAAAIVSFLRLTRLTGVRRVVAVGSLLVFWPLLLYLPTTMQESVHS